MIEGKIAQLEAEKAEAEKHFTLFRSNISQVGQLYEQVESLNSVNRHCNRALAGTG